MNEVNKDWQLNRKMNKTTQTAISLKKYIMPISIIPIKGCSQKCKLMLWECQKLRNL